MEASGLGGSNDIGTVRLGSPEGAPKGRRPPAGEPADAGQAGDLATSAGLRPLVEQLLRGIATAVQADRATLTRLQTASSVVIEGSIDINGRPAETGRVWQITAPEFQRLVGQLNPAILDVSTAELPSPFREQLADVRHLVTIPLVDEGRVFGTVAVGRREDRPFDLHDVEVLRELGSVAVLALHNAPKLAHVESVAYELRSTEERFRLLVQGVKEYAIFMLDEKGHITSWNPGAQRIKGYDEAEILGQHFSIFYTPNDVARGKPWRALSIAKSRGRYEEEGWRMKKDGSRFFASVVITALRDDAGNLRGFAKVTRDITDKRRMQDELLDAQRREAARFKELAAKAEAVERTKSAFLNLASHELRTPLSLLGGYMSLLADGDLGELNQAGHRAVKVLKTQMLQLNFLVQQMLEAASLQSGTLDLNQEAVDLRDAVEAALDWVRELAGPEYTLRLSLPERPVTVLADAGRLSDILRNLLDNAVKYSPNGGRIDCEVLADDVTARVKVKDEGVGIAADQRDQLFEQFGRVVSGDTAAISGAGLGLYLARALARLHGGDIVVESTPGHGSQFSLSLPIAPAGTTTGESQATTHKG